MASLNLVAKLNIQVAGMAVRVKALPMHATAQNFCGFEPGPVQNKYFFYNQNYFISKNLITNAYVN